MPHFATTRSNSPLCNELSPSGYTPPSILTTQSKVTNRPRGGTTTATGRKVVFSSPLTSSQPLANPFMFRNIPVAVLQQQQGLIQGGGSSATGSSSCGGATDSSSNSSNNNNSNMGRISSALDTTGLNNNNISNQNSSSSATLRAGIVNSNPGTIRGF